MKGEMMIIYQVVDESNMLMGEFSSYERAMEEAEEMTLGDDENHHYRVVRFDNRHTKTQSLVFN